MKDKKVSDDARQEVLAMIEQFKCAESICDQFKENKNVIPVLLETLYRQAGKDDFKEKRENFLNVANKRVYRVIKALDAMKGFYLNLGTKIEDALGDAADEIFDEDCCEVDSGFINQCSFDCNSCPMTEKEDEDEKKIDLQQLIKEFNEEFGGEDEDWEDDEDWDDDEEDFECNDCENKEGCIHFIRNCIEDDEWCEGCDCKDACAFDCMKDRNTKGSPFLVKQLEVMNHNYECEKWYADSFVNVEEYYDDDLIKLNAYHEIDKEVFFEMFLMLNSFKDILLYLKASLRDKMNMENEVYGSRGTAHAEWSKWLYNRYFGESGERGFVSIPMAYNTMIELLSQLEEVVLNMEEHKVMASVPMNYSVLDGSETKRPLRVLKLFGDREINRDNYDREMRLIPISAARLDGYMNELGNWIIGDDEGDCDEDKEDCDF